MTLNNPDLRMGPAPLYADDKFGHQKVHCAFLTLLKQAFEEWQLLYV